MIKYDDWLYCFGMHETIDILGLVVVNNQSLNRELMKYYTTGIVSEYFAKMLIELAYRNIKKRRYANLVYKDDMIGHICTHLICHILPMLKNRNAVVSNPYAFLTTTVLSCIAGFLSKERKQTEIKNDYQLII